MSSMNSEVDPVAESYYKKLTSPSSNRRFNTTGDGSVTPTPWELNPIHKSLMRRRMDSEKIYDALPDMETIISTAVSSLLCTKDLVTSSLIYDSNSPEEEIPLEVKDAMLQVIRDFFNKEKKLPQQLYTWLYDAMAFSGATPVMIISESAIDQMFGLARENFTDTHNDKLKGMLKANVGNLWGAIDGESRHLQFEGFSKQNLQSSNLSFNPLESGPDELKNALNISAKIHLVDDSSMLKIPEMRKKMLKSESFTEKAMARFEQSYNKSQAPDNEMSAKERGKQLNPNYDDNPDKVKVIHVPEAKEAGRSNTHPFESVLPAEAVIPVTMPGSESEPVAYLVSMDNGGNPLSLRTAGSMDNLFVNTAGSVTDVVSSTARALGLGEDELSMTIPKLMEQHAELTERQFIKSLENGSMGEGITLGKNEEFYRVITARHLAKRDTNILCVPADQLAYFYVDIDANGIGRSIIDRSKVISTARMVHLFATMRGMIENSSRRMLYTITLPEEERDGERAVAMATHDITRKNMSLMPAWGDVDDIYAQVNNSGINIKVMGNDHYPSSDIEQSDITPDFKLPERELDEQFIRRVCAVARIDPDLILQPENIEFASQIWSKSLISAKQVIMKQLIVNKTASKYCRSFTYSSGILLDRLVEAIKSSGVYNKDEDAVKIPRYIRLFLNGLEVTLPQPDTTFTKSQMEQYTDKMDIIREIVEQVVTDSVADEVEMESTKLRELIVTWYSLSWLRNNGVETELIDMFLSEDDHTAIVKDLTDRHSVIAGLILRIDKHFNSKMETVKNKYGAVEEEPEGGFGGEGSDEFGGEGAEGDEFSEGGDELGGESDEFSDDLDGDTPPEFGDDLEGGGEGDNFDSDFSDESSSDDDAPPSLDDADIDIDGDFDDEGSGSSDDELTDDVDGDSEGDADAESVEGDDEQDQDKEEEEEDE